MNTLTLWEIEKGIFDLYEALDEAETPEAREACEQALAEYFAREVVKVDAIRGLYRHFEALAVAARQEARDISARAAMFERRCESIKAMAKVVMEASPQLDGRLEGRRGRILLKTNGGVLPLEVTDAAAVPDECVKYHGWIGGDMWRDLQRAYEDEGLDWASIFKPDVDYRLERVVDNERTRKALEAEGGVPGARLGERGRHIEFK